MNTPIKIKVTSTALRSMLIKLADENEITFYGSRKEQVESAIEKVSAYPYAFLSKEEFSFCTANSFFSNKAKEVTFEEFILAMVGDNRIEVKLNGTYTASVGKDGVRVGCQTFPLSVIDELAAAKAKIS
jgi:hypothetical protein